MQEFYTLITEVGGAMIANATILGQKVNITNFAVGDGAGNYYTPTAEMTELKREVWRGKPTSVEIDPQNPNMMVVSTVIPADIGGFTIREMGLFTEDGKLIAISNCPELQKVTLGTGVASELALTMQIAVSNAETIEFKVDPTVIIATKSDVEKAKEELEAPTFDDSGTVANIQSFTDFINDIKSKMNIFEFYRNLKAGMQYVVHTGKLINNTNTTEEGFALDARVGKYLQDQIYANKEDAISKSSVVNNVTTMVDGTVLDGRVGKYLQEQIDEQNNNLNGIYYKELKLIRDSKFINTTPVFTYHGYINGWDEQIDKSMLPTTEGTWWDIQYYPTIYYGADILADNQAKMIAISSKGDLYIRTHHSKGWSKWVNASGVSSQNGVDVRTLNTGSYYITNGLNAPPNFPHGYLTVQRLDPNWAFLTFQYPYGSEYKMFITKQTGGTWQNWANIQVII